jgi:toxin ParE1/3/4
VTQNYVVATDAKDDIRRILIWSQEHFGDQVRDGYEELIFAGMSDAASNPTRVGSHPEPELGTTVRSWHLALSRDHVPGYARRIKSPRHFVIYRANGDEVTILRLLHDTMNLPLHHVP